MNKGFSASVSSEILAALTVCSHLQQWRCSLSWDHCRLDTGIIKSPSRRTRLLISVLTIAIFTSLFFSPLEAKSGCSPQHRHSETSIKGIIPENCQSPQELNIKAPNPSPNTNTEEHVRHKPWTLPLEKELLKSVATAFPTEEMLMFTLLQSVRQQCLHVQNMEPRTLNCADNRIRGPHPQRI